MAGGKILLLNIRMLAMKNQEILFFGNSPFALLFVITGIVTFFLNTFLILLQIDPFNPSKPSKYQNNLQLDM